MGQDDDAHEEVPTTNYKQLSNMAQREEGLMGNVLVSELTSN